MRSLGDRASLRVRACVCVCACVCVAVYELTYPILSYKDEDADIGRNVALMLTGFTALVKPSASLKLQ